MNAAQVNQEWWQAARAERARQKAEVQARLAALAEERARALAWSMVAFPDRVEAGWACPFAAQLAIEDRRRHGGNPSRTRVAARLARLIAKRDDPDDPWAGRPAKEAV